MANEQQPLNINPTDKPVFADTIGTVVRIKAVKNEKTGKFQKECLVSIMFIDSMRKQLLGEFIVNRATAKELYTVLNQTIEKLEIELASGDAPKQPEVKTTGDFSNII